MWTPLVFLLVVTTAFGLEGPWRPNTEYTFQIHSRTYSGFPELRQQYAAVVGRGQLKLQTVSNGNSYFLVGRVQNYENANYNGDVPNVYPADIPEENLRYQISNLNNKPFRIFLSQGNVEKLEVDKSMSNDEVNQLKGILSQIQYDMQGKNMIPWKQNQLPSEENGVASGLFTVMEPTIIGQCETIYKVSPIAPYAVPNSYAHYTQSLPVPAGKPVFQIEKTVDFSNCIQVRGYNHGANGQNVHSNQIGQFLTRKVVNTMVASGTPVNYTIHYSRTYMRVASAPELFQKQTAITTSSVELYLTNVLPSKTPLPAPNQPQNVGKLVYRYNIPSDRTNQARVGPDSSQYQSGYYQQYRSLDQSNQQGYDTSDESDEQQYGSNRNSKSRVPRSTYPRSQQQAPEVPMYPSSVGKQENNLQMSQQSQDAFWQPVAVMEQAPEHPLLPYFVGNRGRAIRFDRDMVEQIVAQVTAITQSLHDTDHVSHQHILEKFNILVDLVASSNYKDIQTVDQKLAQNPQSSGNSNNASIAWYVFRDAVVLGGSGPTTLTLTQWLSTGEWNSVEAYAALVMQPKVVTTPTVEHISAYLSLVQNKEISNQRNVYTAALFTLAELVSRSYSNRYNHRNIYPEDSYGPFGPYLKDVVENQVIPYFNQSLQKAFQVKNDREILLHIRAYANLGHPSYLNVFKQYYEQREALPAFQRAALVLGLDQFGAEYSDLTKPILFNIYMNVAEDPDVRSIAVLMLIAADPDTVVLQQVASFTNQDPSLQVQSVVKYTLESIANLETERDQGRIKRAQSAVHFLNPRSYENGYSYYTVFAETFKNLNYNRKRRFSILTSSDSRFPHMVSMHIADRWGGVYEERAQFNSYVSSVEDLLRRFYWPKESGAEAYNDPEVLTTRPNNQDNEDDGLPKIPLPPQVANLAEQFKNIVFSHVLSTAGLPPNVPNPPKYSPVQQSTNEGASQRFQGFTHYRLFGGMKYHTYDEESLNNLPQVLDRFTQLFQNGRQVHYHKFYKDDSITIAFPLTTGYPYFYRWDKPTYVHMRGDLTFKNSQPFGDGKSPIIHIPAAINISANAVFTYSTNHITQAGFFTPNNGRQYVAGHVRRLMYNLPINFDMDLDLLNHKVSGALMPVGKAVLAHYSSVPYTAEKDVFSVVPDTANPRGTKVVHARQPKVVQRQLGAQSTGLILSVQGQYETQRDSYGPIPYLVGGVPKSSLWEAFFQPSEGVEAYNIQVSYSDLDTKTDGMRFGFALKSGVVRRQNYNKYESNPIYPQADYNKKKRYSESSFAPAGTPHQGIAFLQDADQLFEKITPSLTNGRSTVASAWVAFAGPGTQTVYEAVGSYSTSRPSGLTRITAGLRRNELNYFNEKQYCFEMNTKEAGNTYYATSSLDKAANENRQLGMQFRFTIGPDCVSGGQHPNNTEILGIAIMNQTMAYQQQILDSQVAQQCKEDSAAGNFQSPACRKAIRNLRVPNTLNFHIEQTGSDKYVRDILQMIAHQQKNPIVKNTILAQRDIKKASGTFLLGQDTKYYDGKLQYGNLQYEVHDLEVTPLVRNIAFDEPIYAQFPYTQGIARDSVCVVDASQITTFDGAMFNRSIGRCSYTVAQTYYPKRQPNEPTILPAYHSDVTIMMADQTGVPFGREVTVFFYTNPEGIIYRLHLYGRGKGLRPAVILWQGESTSLLQPDQHNEVIVGSEVKLHVHPQTVSDDNTVVVDLHGARMRIVFNGETIRVEADPSYRNKLRGLCGSNDLEPYTDRQSPRHCVYRDPKYFIESWANSEELVFCHSEVKEIVAEAQTAECYPIKYIPNIVVKPQGRTYEPSANWQQGPNTARTTAEVNNSNRCQLVDQIQYVNNQGQVCFSSKPLAACPSDCQSTLQRSKVDVHCYSKNDPRARAHIQAIKRGQNHLIWGNNTVRKTLEFNVPTTCRTH